MTITVLQEALQLPVISLTAATEYHECIEALTEQVDVELTNNTAILELIGYNSLELMYANHRYHARFMSTIFRLNAYELMSGIIVWVYRSYHLRGFSYEYFPAELRAWQKAVSNTLTSLSATEINRIYQWMLQHHQAFIGLAESPDYKTLPIINNLHEMGETMLSLMLHNDYQLCLELTVACVHSAQELSDFYTDVLGPCLYEIGRLWEEGKISVVQEHLATAIATRVMAVMYQNFLVDTVTKGRVVIMPAPNEPHEVGARMCADLLEMDGWYVEYLGEKLTVADILQSLRTSKPQLLGISVVMPYHLDGVCQIIAAIKKDSVLKNIIILVGGTAFATSPELWRATGAEAYCTDSRQAVEFAADWWKTQRGIL